MAGRAPVLQPVSRGPECSALSVVAYCQLTYDTRGYYLVLRQLLSDRKDIERKDFGQGWIQFHCNG